jgi:peptidoglycan/LPS O-acetylase OafA/YrhL
MVGVAEAERPLSDRDKPVERRPLTHRTNNFDFLRLFGALLVVLGHAYPLLGAPAATPGLIGHGVQSIGVVIFFSISGYLITASWNRTRDPLSYAAARCLRIFPGLAAVVLLCAFVLGPLVTVLPVADYAVHPQTVDYVNNILMKPVYFLPGVFADLPYASVVNGSLWTLPAEFLCYIVVPLALVLPRLARPAVVLVLLALSLWYSATPPMESAVIYGTRISDAAVMWVFFATGVLLRLGHERISGLFRADVAVALFAAYLLVIAIQPTWVGNVSWAVLPYVVMTVGLASTPYVRRAARFGDLSYGIYLWAFPVQQVLVHLIGVQNMTLNLVMVSVLSAMCALISWHLVEKPALLLKDKVPRLSRRRG